MGNLTAGKERNWKRRWERNGKTIASRREGMTEILKNSLPLIEAKKPIKRSKPGGKIGEKKGMVVWNCQKDAEKCQGKKKKLTLWGTTGREKSSLVIKRRQQFH